MCVVRVASVLLWMRCITCRGTTGRPRRQTAASPARRLTLAPHHVSGPFAVERFLKSRCLFLRERAGGESQRMGETAGCGSPDKVSSHIVPPATELAPLLFIYFFPLSVLHSISLHLQSPGCRGQSGRLKLHLSDKRQTANTEGIQGSPRIAATVKQSFRWFFFSPRWLVPSAWQSPGWV